MARSMKQQTISNSTTSGNTKQAAYHDHFKVKSCSSWDAGNYEYNCNNWRSTEEAGDLVGAAGFSWPPRSYTCSFCKREFRSAQALGGHMNVHRRDRARLRHSSPITDHNQYYYNNINNSDTNSVLNLNLDIPYNNPSTFNYSPNPNSSPRRYSLISQSSSPPPPPLSSLLTKFPQFSTTLPPLSANVVEVNVNRKPSCIITKDFIKMNKAVAPKGLFGAEKVISSSAYEKVYKKASFLGLDLEIGLINGQSEEELDLELRLGYTNN